MNIIVTKPLTRKTTANKRRRFLQTTLVIVSFISSDDDVLMFLISGWTVAGSQRGWSGQLFRHDGHGLGPSGRGHVHDEAHLLPDTAKQASRETGGPGRR